MPREKWKHGARYSMSVPIFWWYPPPALPPLFFPPPFCGLANGLLGCNSPTLPNYLFLKHLKLQSLQKLPEVRERNLKCRDLFIDFTNCVFLFNYYFIFLLWYILNLVLLIIGKKAPETIIFLKKKRGKNYESRPLYLTIV